MAGKRNVSFVLQVMSGLVSDTDTAHDVLNHTSAAVFRHIDNDGIESLFESEWLESQLGILLHCLGVISPDNDYQLSDVCDGSGSTSSGQTSSISDSCMNLLDHLCCLVLDHAMAFGMSSESSDRVVSDVLSLTVSCFKFVACDARTKVSRMLISLLRYKENSSFHLRVVKVLSQLYECRDYAADFHQSATDELMSVIEELCLTENESCIAGILVQLVPSVLTHCSRREVVMARLWSIVERCHTAGNDGHISQCCFLICCLTDVFFTPNSTSTSFSANLLGSSVLWNCVQKGLQHGASLTRKRAIFILRRALDFAGMIESSIESMAVGDCSDLLNSIECLSQLTSVWHEIIILFETLEEKQVGHCVGL